MDFMFLKKLFFLINRWLQKKASLINHNAVIKDIYTEAEVSAGYFLILSFANLIALSGLITNSAPVIIGAMLISPLMGPMLSFGFAFITGDKFIWDKAVKKISISVAVTIIVAAIATHLSPLKDITSEILARTRPNLYDLIIASLAGTAGGVALCTKKNYLTIVPGVAIATAVIPPLSVTGFGLGIWNFKLFLGGFFLFFTNFVAIVLSTCLVFYIYGFKPSIMTETDTTRLKKRLISLASVLFILSIPLIYTLYQSISEVTLRNDIQNILKNTFDKEKQHSLLTFSYSKKKDGKIEINTVINTIEYLREPEILNIEKNLNDRLNRNVKLYLEQVKVQPGGLKEEVVKPPTPTIAPSKAPSDVIKSSRESVVTIIRQSSEKIEKIISPSTIADFYVGFHDKTFKVVISMKLKKDAPVTEDEILWLRRIFAMDLNLPVDLQVETIPFVPLLVFKKGETTLSDEMKLAILPLKEVYQKDNSIIAKVEAQPDSVGNSRKGQELAEERVKSITKVLIEDCQIPERQIEIMIHKRAVQTPSVKISIMTGGK